MFGSRVIFCVQGRTHYFVRTPHLVKPRELFIKEYHPSRIRLCSHVKNTKPRLASNVVKVENIDLEKLERSTVKSPEKFGNFRKSDLYKENTHKKCEGENEAINDTKLIENEILYKDLSKLYPDSRSAVANIYQILKNELADQSLLRIQYKSCKIKKKLFWECTYSVSWPTKKSFTEIKESKKSASNEAAFKCLYWLHEQGKLKNSKPIIYTKNEIQAKLHKPVPIHLDSEILKEVKELLHIYKVDVKNIIESPKSSSDLFTLRKKNDIDVIFTSFPYCYKRNQMLQERLLSKTVNEHSDLPILQYREKILKKLENNNILLISGSTGCGKTTQVPQFIMDSYIKQGNATDCNILISQPRRISAISLAERIASERGETVGDVVGYSVRLQKQYPQFPAGMLFCTTGILCQIIQNNPNLKGYSHVVLDEVHERTMEIDILFVLLKRALLNNPSLKLIIMSATINTELFSKYFNCDTIDVPGKMFPVKMHFLEDFKDVLPRPTKQKNLDFYENDINQNTNILTIDSQQIVSLIKWILNKKSPGTILCFLPGWSEIKNIKFLLTMDNSIQQKLLILQLHSKLPIGKQQRIFDPAPRNTTKIILATDIAETGITVPDVVYVIDTTIKNNPTWDNDKFSIHSQRISKANIQQRKGRAGRVQAGESYHFITKTEYNDLRSNPMPEILFSPLETIIINIKCHTDEKFAQFCEHMIEPPSRIVIHNALKTLMQLDIIDEHEHLTPLGKRLAHISIHPSLGKALILSTIFKCSEPILSIATLNSMDQDIFVNTLSDKSSKKEVKEIYHQTSDHLATAKLYEEWNKNLNESNFKSELFCNEKNINPFRMQLFMKIRDMFSNRLQIYGIQDHDHSYLYSEMLPSKDTYCDELIYGIMFSSTNKLIQKNDFSYYRGIFKQRTELKNENNRAVKIMVESVNYKRTSWPSSYLTYLYGVHHENIPYMLVYNTSIISPLTLLLFGAGHIRKEPNDDSNNQETITLILRERKTLKFSCTSEEVKMLKSFREVIWSVVDYFLKIDNNCSGLVNELNFMNEYRTEMLRVLSKMLDTSAKQNKNVQ
ncbi:PREDICTED: putative ATP-dependent RNA helicase DHX30 [Polistes dominula]|uniref:RNA helicase n=1 Tax=Polistes dominula TaxID=743375 RepID=A0ABM1J5X1_POLDO|nr:PREDICTED: putative ATP-dependent RNA helicase DHX30 [Polistes dominula]